MMISSLLRGSSRAFGLGTAVAVAMLLLGTSPASAQDGAVTGTVSDAQTGEPISGAQVFVQGTNLGTLTDQSGAYRLEGVPGGQQTVRVRLIGYAAASRSVQVSAGQATSANFQLQQRAIALDEVVVTGVSGATMQAKVPFSVTQMNADQMPVPSTSATGILQGKVAGVTITSGSGRPGSDPSVLLRGATSLDASGRSQEPLYIVDGAIVQGGMSAIGSLDIKNIEVVKGAAAASMYGSRAQNGVIQITTKDGSAQETNTVSYTVRSEYGQSGIEGSFLLPSRHEWAMNDAGTAFVNSDGSTCQIFAECSSPTVAGNAPWRESGAPAGSWNTIMANEWPGQTYDQVDRFMTDGEYYDVYGSASGNTGNTNFHASYNRTSEEGVMPGQEGFLRENVRLNVNQSLKENLNVAASAFYSASSEEPGFTGGALFDLTRMPAGIDLQGCEDDVTANCMDDPQNLILQPDPTNTESGNPLYQMLVREPLQEDSRFLGSANANYEPLPWFGIQANVSYDRTDVALEDYYPKGYRCIGGCSQEDGVLQKYDSQEEALNASVTGTFDFELTDDISNTTRLRYLYERQNILENNTEGTSFAVADVPTLDNLGNYSNIYSSSQPVRSDGYFLITNFDISDKYIVDLLVRNDGSSLFGEDERRHFYYRGAAAWRVTQEDWFADNGVFDELKLRYSYGTAGGRPSFEAQYETFNVSAGRVAPQTLGNNDLKPELSKEHEAGIDAIVADRFTLGVTYARTVTEDQIMEVPLPSFSGYATQWQNAGELTSNTWEASLQTDIIRGDDLSWSANVIWDRTRTEITGMNRPAFQYGVGGQGLGTVFYAREGEEIGTFYGSQFARDCGDLPEGTSCDGFTQNEDGFLVWTGGSGLDANNWGQSSDVLVGGTPVSWGTPFQGRCTDRTSGEETTFCPVGNSTPDWSGSFSSTFTWGGLQVYGLLHTEQGFDVYNQPLEWAVFQRTAGIYDSEAGQPLEQQKPLGYYDAWYGVNGLAPDDEFVEDGSYVKLREVSLRYRFTQDQLSSVPGLNVFNSVALRVSGRNLVTWTDYRGFDPEVGESGGDTGSAAIARVAGYQYPNFRTFQAGLELNF